MGFFGRIASLGMRTGRFLLTTPSGLALTGGVAATNVYLQNELGTVTDFFEVSFTTTKDQDAISDFYSTEDFLQILGIFPPVIKLILSGVEWSNEREQTMTVYNTMQISFDITEKEEEIDGKTYTTYFNKRERFVQYIPYMPVLLWDQVQNYGFKRQPDGTLKVIHQGEYFKGPWFVRYLVQLHAYYVLWATEKHINSQLFGTEDLEAQEEQRGNIPLHVFNEWLVEQQAQKNAADKAAGLDTTAGEANVKALKKLKRNNSVVEVKKIKRNQSLLTSSGPPDTVDKLRLSSDDPEAQKAIREALKHLGGSEAQAATESLAKKLAEAKKTEAK